MILAQLNIVKFYSAKANRNWDNSSNKQQHIVFLPVNVSNEVYIPSIQLIVSTSVVAPTMSIIFNKNNVIAETVNLTVEEETGYARLIYLGAYSESFTVTEDYFYLKITNGIYIYYSDVFAVTSDLSKLLKITAASSNIAMGRKADYTFNMVGFSYLCYLNVCKRASPDYEEEELANENNGMIIPYYSGQSKQYNWTISGTEYILDFLKRLRQLSINGAVTFLWNGETLAANDIDVDVEDSYDDGNLLDILVKIKPYNEVVMVINAIS